MTAATDPRLDAVRAILGVVAMDMHAAVRALNEAIGTDDLTHAVAAVALVQRAGFLADEAAARMGQARVDDAEAWTTCPTARRALEVLR